MEGGKAREGGKERRGKEAREGEGRGGSDRMKESLGRYADACWGVIMGETDGVSRY